METKECTKCHEIKPLSGFAADHRGGNGYLHVCRACKAAYIKAYFAANPDQREKARKRKQKWRADPVNREYENAKQYQRWRDNPENFARASRKHLYKKKYGRSIEDYERIIEEQGGGCAICGGGSEIKQHRFFQWDHDHTCCPDEITCHKCVRGLLCTNCNTALGGFKDDPNILRAAIAYLEKWVRSPVSGAE